MSLQRRNIWKLLFWLTSMNQAVERPQGKTCFFTRVVMKINCIIFRVLLAIFLQFFIEKAPWQICIICDHNFIEVGLAYWTLLIFQNKSQSQRTSVTNISVITNTKGEILEWVETKNAVIMILDINSWGADVAFFAGTSCLLHLFIIKFTNTIQIIRFKDSNSN